MKSFKLFLVAILFPLVAFTSIHKFYVSVTQVEYIKEKQSVQIITRIFIDDLEDLLRQRYDNKITLNISKEEQSIDAYIGKYLTAKMQININDKPISFTFIGKEYEDDIVYCYMEISDITSITSFEITNQILFDVFDEQQNIVRTNINSKKKSFMLTSNNETGVLNFN